MIRAATHADIPRLVELGQAMHAESRFRRYPYEIEDVAHSLAALISSPTVGVVLVEEAGGEIIGGFAGVVAPFFFASKVKFASDMALFVLPGKRGGMAAAKLVRAFHAWAKEQGASETNLGINTGVHPERTGRFFERLGFKCCGALYLQEVNDVH